MNHFDGCRDSQSRICRNAEHLRTGNHQKGSNTLTAGKRCISHGFDEFGFRFLVIDRQQPVQQIGHGRGVIAKGFLKVGQDETLFRFAGFELGRPVGIENDLVHSGFRFLQLGFAMTF